ncbi:MAG: sugar ABC transporter permease [Anaerolineae bacterium]|nr:sugar ABC transporter permease [Anaerolineae bacterium]
MRVSLRTYYAITGYGFISLWLVGFSVFMLIPLVRNAIWSLTDINMGNVSEPLNFIGLANYVEAFTIDIEFVPYLLETLRNLVVDVPIILAFSLAVALLAMQDVPGGTVFRAIFFLPVVIGSAAVIGRLFGMFGGQLVLFRGEGAQQFLQIYLGERLPDFMQFINRSIFVLWRSGVQILIFIAGLKSIDPALYEAAEVDGASAWSRFWKVTLPMLSPVMLVNIIYTIIDSFTDYFNRVLWYMRLISFRTDLRLGYPSALGFIYFLLIFVFVIIVFTVVGRVTFYRGER